MAEQFVAFGVDRGCRNHAHGGSARSFSNSHDFIHHPDESEGFNTSRLGPC
jgi:hypothetical protein